jgi:3-hydroxyisobutyrate dehydrogenase-like beta-hydroxyacid dehydrogenase
LHDLITSTIFAGSPIYKNYGSQILDQRFEAGFKLRLGLKDVRLALAAGEAVHAPLPFASALQDVMQDAVDAGDGDKDWTALARVIERRSQADPVAP